jgi:NTE family protein
MRALEWDHAQMLDAMDHIDRAPLWRDLGPPLLSMMSGHHYERLLRGLFGDLALEDLALPLLPVCARLRDGAVVVPARGELWRAVRASTALPGVWPPLPYEGELLVDGGISNHLPVDLARARCGLGPVVACDAGHELRVDHEDVAMVPASGWSRLARWLWPFGRSRRGLTLLDVLLSATCAAATRQREQAIADATLYLRPFAEADATSVAAMVALGYDTTRAALDRADPRVLGARAATTT